MKILLLSHYTSGNSIWDIKTNSERDSLPPRHAYSANIMWRPTRTGFRHLPTLSGTGAATVMEIPKNTATWPSAGMDWPSSESGHQGTTKNANNVNIGKHTWYLFFHQILVSVGTGYEPSGFRTKYGVARRGATTRGAVLSNDADIEQSWKGDKEGQEN